jgi:3-oxoacyl-[acyl-carrier protein] reductase
MDLGLAGKRALIVGGNRGIGFGIAKALVEEGADVAIAARDIARLSLAASELQKSARGKVTTAEFDLSRTDEIPSFAKALIERFGPIDILLNNTGGPTYGGAAGRPVEDWRSAFQDMVLSVISLTDALLPGMRARHWGRILTVVSSGIIQPIPVLAISNSLRASLVNWSKTLSEEVAADGVTANILMPGRIDTERVRLTDEATAKRQGIPADDVARRSASTIPMGRYGRVDELAAVAAFVLSERASYMTGSIVRVDGGIVRAP